MTIKPFISAEQSLPEITLKSLILGLILVIILAMANAYLGLKVGQTISASIPAAIISMAILRFFRNANVLENIMVQTMASVGESIISGVTFILPAFIILHVWDEFYYWQTMAIALLGGLLGVFFTIPLRRALLNDKNLRYPEAVAIANVFRASADKDKNEIKTLSIGGIIGGFISLCQAGFQILTDHVSFWFQAAGTVFGCGLGLSPALIAAGYIVGIQACISILVGILIGWIIGVPILTWVFGVPLMDPLNASNAMDIALTIWRLHIRNIGVGAMLVGGLWTLIRLLKPIFSSLSASIASLKKHTTLRHRISLRTERDIPINYVFWGILLLLVPIFLLIAFSIIPTNLSLSDLSHISNTTRFFYGGFCCIYVLIGGFVFCSIAAYCSGLVGSTNTPASGLLVSSVLILCLMLLGLFSLQGNVASKALLGVLLGIGTTIIISTGSSIATDTMQDLKVGQLIGATPWKQQLMLFIGVMIVSILMPPILNLLYHAYGIAGVFPHIGMNKSQMLAAPQAGLMAAIAQGVYAQNLEWITIELGAVIAVICIIIDKILHRYHRSLPVLAIGIGIYLPLESSVPIVIGGLLSYFIQIKLNKRYFLHRRVHQKIKIDRQIKIDRHCHQGLLLCCGIVAGASLMGVILAVPFTLTKNPDVLKIMPHSLEFLVSTLSILVTIGLCTFIYSTVMKEKNKDESS